MAFLCPSRRGRQKKKHKEPKTPFLGRITGSASIDTLVRVGLEKQHGLTSDSRMRVTQDFLATRKDELGAQQGDVVYRLYQDGDWVYAITEKGQEGFIPTICVIPIDDTALPIGSKVKRNSFVAASVNEAAQISDGSFTSQNGSAVRAKSTGHPSHHSRRKNSTGLDISTQAETGSDVSSSSLLQSFISPDTINPLPKPNRTHNIPDVVSTTNNLSRTSADTNITSSHHTNSDLKEHVHKRNGIRNHGNTNAHYSQKHKKGNSASDALDNKCTLSVDMTKSGLRASQVSVVDSITEVKTFVKKVGKKMVVVFPFSAMDENDVDVEKGEVVRVLNEKDQHWTWIKKRNGTEGFVPRAFVCSIPENLLTNSSQPGKSESRPKEVTSRPVQYHDVRELYTLRHFTAQSADDISVKAGEQVFADLANQIERDWLWVYAPTNQCYGYIPKDNVTLPSDSTMFA